MIRAATMLLVLVALSACAPRRAGVSPGTDLGMHIGPSGKVYPSVRTDLGPVGISAVGRNGVIGTRIGGLGISAAL